MENGKGGRAVGVDSNGDCSSLGYYSKFKGCSPRRDPLEARVHDTQKLFDPSWPSTRLTLSSSDEFLKFEKWLEEI